MARKRLTDVPKAAHIRQLIAAKKFAAAVDETRKLKAYGAEDSTDELLRTALLALAEFHRGRQQWRDFDAAVAELEPLCSRGGVPTLRALNLLFVRGKRTAEVLRLANQYPDAGPLLLGDFADHTVRHHDASALPPDWKPAYSALQTALQNYESKADDAARDALQTIGLGSPFLEWKLWLRGLLAWSAGDNSRAIENWSRLNPTRTPYRVAAPLWNQVDDEWKKGEPIERERLQAQYQRLRSGGVAVLLRNLRPELAKREPMRKVFAQLEVLVPKLQASHPTLVPKLRDLVYHTMQKRAEQEDLPLFKKIFGPHPQDPTFFKLSAEICESLAIAEVAFAMWGNYAAWLRVQTETPPVLKRHMQAIIYQKQAKLSLMNEDAADGFDIGAMLRGKKPDKSPPAAKLPDPIGLLRKAQELAPDWEEPTIGLINVFLERDQIKPAIQAAEEYVAAHPNAAEIRKLLIEMHFGTGVFDLAYPHLATLRKANPFDAELRKKAAAATLYFAQILADIGNWTLFEQLLADERDVLETESPLTLVWLRWANAKRSKQPAVEPPAPAIIDHFTKMAYSQIFRLKPAEKSAATKNYKAALAEETRVEPLFALFKQYRFFATGSVEFTGFKAHLKPIQAALLEALNTPALAEVQAVAVFEELAGTLAPASLEKLGEQLARRFPKNPLFPLRIVEAWIDKELQSRPPSKITQKLRMAKRLSQVDDPEYKKYRERIQAAAEEIDPFFSIGAMFDGFFGDDR